MLTGSQSGLCKERKHDAGQISWLSELGFCDFDIKYRSGKTNLVADASSLCPPRLDSESEPVNVCRKAPVPYCSWKYVLKSCFPMYSIDNF